MKIISLPEDRWQEYRDLRIKSIHENPQSFHDTVEECLSKDKSFWTNWYKNHLLAEENGQLIGMVGGYRESKPMLKHVSHIVSFYVDPLHRGKGVGKKLLVAMIEKLSFHHRSKKITLGVVTTQQSAIHLYESLGFQRVGHSKYAVRVGEKYYDEYMMELYL